MSRQFSISSDLAVAPADLWDAVVCPSDINAEFQPLLKMTFPQGLEDVTQGWQPGETRFRSWILLGALIPVEYDDLTFVEVEIGKYFLERSSMASQAVWEHRRELEPVEGGTRVTDTVSFEPRLALLESLQFSLFTWIFRRRHRQLRRRYGPTETYHGT